MKKILVLFFLVVSFSAFGQKKEEEVFDLYDDVVTENEQNFLDFYNNHWSEDRESTKKMLVKMMVLFDGLKELDSDVEEFFGIFSEIVYGDEFAAMAELWEEGFIPNSGAMAALCNICLIANDDLSDKTIVKGYKILKKYCEEERVFPVTFGTSEYNDLYR